MEANDKYIENNIQVENEFVIDSASKFMRKCAPDAMIKNMPDYVFDEIVKIKVSIKDNK